MHAIIYHLYMLTPCVVLGQSADAAFGALRDELMDHFVPGSDFHSALDKCVNIQEIEIALRSELEYLDEFPLPHILRRDITAACVIIYQLCAHEHPRVVVDEDGPAARARLRAELAEAHGGELALLDQYTCPVAQSA